MQHMAEITPLNFEPADKIIPDKKQGLEIEIGHFSALPAVYADIEKINEGVGVSLENKGFDQKELDMLCAKIYGEAKIEEINVLLTKSDIDFDPRWYWLGDLPALFAWARKSKTVLPISPFLYDNILENLKAFQ